MPNPMDVVSSQAYGITMPDGTVKDSNTDQNYTQDQWNDRLVSDSEEDAIAKWAQENGYKLNADTIDYIYNQYFTEKNNTTAWERTMEADRTQYQRAVADLKAAGINPIQILGGYGANSPSAQTGSVGSGSLASSQNSKRQNATDMATKLMQVLGLIGGALIYALL